MNFTYKTYQTLLKLLRSKYQFISFSYAKYNNLQETGNLLLRHDIDQSLEKALIMAEIENSYNVSATYFIFLRSPFYNAFANKEKSIIKRIIELNHFIGLHFDYSNNDVNSLSHLIFQIKSEAEFIQNYFNVHVDAVSFHRPFNLNFFNLLELKNYPHTYEKIFLEKFKYFSDSRGVWRFGNPIESAEFKEGKNLHLLVHPIWWNKSKLNRLDTIIKFKENYINSLDNFLYQELKGFWDEIKLKKK